MNKRYKERVRKETEKLKKDIGVYDRELVEQQEEEEMFWGGKKDKVNRKAKDMQLVDMTRAQQELFRTGRYNPELSQWVVRCCMSLIWYQTALMFLAFMGLFFLFGMEMVAACFGFFGAIIGVIGVLINVGKFDSWLERELEHGQAS